MRLKEYVVVSSKELFAFIAEQTQHRQAGGLDGPIAVPPSLHGENLASALDAVVKLAESEANTILSNKHLDLLAEKANGRIELGLYKGSLFFQKLTDCPGSLYNPADASMEASDGLDPTSSQGYVEVLSAEAVALANAGQIKAPVWD